MKIGIVGSGMIARYVLNVWNAFDAINVTAIWCRKQDIEEAVKLQKEFHIPNVYTDYDAFLHDESFTFAYIGLVNSMHYAYSKQALEAGKNVICEKPFTSTAFQAKELLKTAKRKGLFLFESCLPWYCDNYREIKRLLPQIGQIKMIECNFSQYSRRYENYLKGTVLPVFDPQLDGGALYDLGVYGVHFIMGLVGVPNDVQYFPNIGYNGVDTSGVLLLDYQEFKAASIHAKDCAGPSRCVIQGDKGYILMNSHPGEVKNIHLCINGQESEKIDIIDFKEGFAYVYEKLIPITEAMEYSRCYEMLENVIEVMSVMETARKQAGIKFSCDE